MCGICGALACKGRLDLPPEAPGRMIGVIRHRGPDEFGAWRDDTVFLGHARLSIIDPVDGQQPMADATGRCHLTYNGEVFNYLELRTELEQHGCTFRTRSDTEVVLNAWLVWGPDCVEHFNGQFAFALWDTAERTLFLARDRFGICPLFIAGHGDRLLFASEIKAIGAFPGFALAPDPGGFAEILTYWANVPPATCFRGITQLPPGHTALVRPGRSAGSDGTLLADGVRARRYWSPGFLPADGDRQHVGNTERARLVAELRDRLDGAVTLRMRADVPVGAYLSGGLDSSALTALAHRMSRDRLRTYSLGFDHDGYDERNWQRLLVAHLGVEHHELVVDPQGIAGCLRDVIWHTECPVPRAAPTPLMLLSRHVHQHDCRVVLTGEGADEVFVGYDIHRETKVRSFWSRLPDSRLRPALLGRLHAFQEAPPPDILRSFYGRDLACTDDPLFSHRPRWQSPAIGFLGDEGRRQAATGEAESRLLASLPTEFADWGPVARCQYLEMALFLSGYLLAAQGDRVLMAHSVEGRFPFLDHTLVEFAARIPVSVKLPNLDEKALLKTSVADLVPAAIRQRRKHPYRAPGSPCFHTGPGRALVEEFLSGDGDGWEFWNHDRVAALARKWDTGRILGPRDDSSFVAVLSGRILQRDFGAGFAGRVAASKLDDEHIAWRD